MLNGDHVLKPTPGATDAWVMLGYLFGAMEANGQVTIADWNGAVNTGDETARRLATRRARCTCGISPNTGKRHHDDQCPIQPNGRN